MQAKDITTSMFIRAMLMCAATESYVSTWGVWRQLEAELGHEVPFKVVMAKTLKLDKQRIINGCGCGCGSPMWLGTGEYNGMVDWKDPQAVADAVRRLVPTEE